MSGSGGGGDSIPGTVLVGPKHGGTTTDGMAWTGGKPTDDWGGTKITTYTTPYAMRPEKAKHIRQAFMDCTQLDDKSFRIKDDLSDKGLLDIERIITRHLVERGMDSVFYIKDEGGNMLFLISDYTCIAADRVESEIQRRLALPDTDNESFDRYDQDNLVWSGKLFLNILDTELHSKIISKTDANATGPEIWTAIVSTVSCVTYQQSKNCLEIGEMPK